MGDAARGGEPEQPRARLEPWAAAHGRVPEGWNGLLGSGPRTKFLAAAPAKPFCVNSLACGRHSQDWPCCRRTQSFVVAPSCVGCLVGE